MQHNPLRFYVLLKRFQPFFTMMAMSFVSPLFAQPDSLWLHSYRLGGQAVVSGIITAQNGGVVVCGYTLHQARGDSAVGWIFQLDQNGDSLGFRVLPDFARILQIKRQPSESDFYLSGRSPAFSAMIARCNAAGTILWSRELGIQAEFRDHCFSTTGAVTCCGSRWLDRGSRQDMLAASYDSSGALLWHWTSNLAGWDQAQSISQLSATEVVLSGYTVRTPNAAWLVQLTEGSNNRQPFEFLPAADALIRGPFVIKSGLEEYTIATMQTAADRTSSYALTCLSTSNQERWHTGEQLPATRLELRALRQAGNGNLIVCGMITDSSRGIFLEERLQNGTLLWRERIPAANRDVTGIDIIGSGEVLLAGTQGQNNNQEVFLWRLGRSGPEPVSELTVYRTSPSSADMRLRWQPHRAATSYNVYRGTTAKLVAGEDTFIGNTTVTQYIDHNILLSAHSSHFYLVTAVTDSRAPHQPSTQDQRLRE